MRTLVTGGSGFVGNHLIKELSGRGHEVFASAYNGNISANCVRVEFNVLDAGQIEDVFKGIRPEGIIHLAAQSNVKVAWEHPAETFAVNTIGVINLIEAVKKVVPKAKVISVGSSEEYGLSGKRGEPLNEEYSCLPRNPYASSKLAAGQIALQYARKDNLKVIHVRPFNHFGPGQQPGFVVSDFASQIALIERRRTENILKVGDLNTRRDFTDVRDIVKAYALLLEEDIENGTYNVCSGSAHSVGEILEVLMNMAKTAIRVKIEEARIRPSEVPLFLGSAAKIRQAVGWKPERVFTNSLAETLDWWRNNV